MLLSVFPLFDISKIQITNILDESRANFGINSNLDDISKNPYILSEQYSGIDYNDSISFYKIDNGILPSPDLGITNFFEKDAPERFRSLCVNILRNTTEHSFLSDTVIISSINHKLKNYPELKRVTFNTKYFEVDETFLSEALTIKKQDSKNYIYLKETWEDERIIEKTIKDVFNRSDIVLKTPIAKKFFEEKLFDSDCELAKKNEAKYKDAISKQSDVCFKLFNKPLCVISGAAGTGKTTIVSALLSAIEKVHGAGTSFLLLAPTGKAAQRIREKTRKQSMTIHSLLASKLWLNDNFTYKRKGGMKAKEYSTVIIDECSMIDLGLLAALFRCLDWNRVERFILIGDPNQLPPIGRGKVFSDIIGYINNPMSSYLGILEINLRQMDNIVNNKGTSILELADVYIQEKQINMDFKTSKEIIFKKVQEGGDIDKDLTVYYWKDMDELEKLLSKTFEKDLSKYTKETGDDIQQLWQNFCRSRNKDGYLNASIFQILSPYRGENYGVDYLNTYFQGMVNRNNIERYNLDGITLGDKVIQIKNRSGKKKISAYNFESKENKEEIYNGEIGFTYKHTFDNNGIYGRLEKFTGRFDSRPGIIYNYGYHENNSKKVFSESVEENLELAYVLSIHKAQGSEFDNIYLILPNKESRLLSMELLYTGITRASKHLTIFAQDDISSFTRLCVVEKSNLRRINSSIFEFKPLLDDIIYPIGKWYEENKRISTLSEHYVRSKSEMNIANILAMKEIPFEYETPLFAPDGTMYLPDFTVSWKGKKYYWEHVGRLDIKGYKKHWEEKETWYKTYFPGQLIITYESENQSKDIEKIINDYFK
jgi:energy-coupling factor transporter ATP-binding protein EcfA2